MLSGGHAELMVLGAKRLGFGGETTKDEWFGAKRLVTRDKTQICILTEGIYNCQSWKMATADQRKVMIAIDGSEPAHNAFECKLTEF